MEWNLKLTCYITRTFWDSDTIPKKISNRAKRAAAKKERERERIRALEDAMELQEEVQRQEEIRLMEVKAMWEEREKERKTVGQVEVETETETETGMETESEGRLSEVAPSEEREYGEVVGRGEVCVRVLI
jgi:hypothetical protein